MDEIQRATRSELTPIALFGTATCLMPLFFSVQFVLEREWWPLFTVGVLELAAIGTNVWVWSSWRDAARDSEDARRRAAAEQIEQSTPLEPRTTWGWVWRILLGLWFFQVLWVFFAYGFGFAAPAHLLMFVTLAALDAWAWWHFVCRRKKVADVGREITSQNQPLMA